MHGVDNVIKKHTICCLLFKKAKLFFSNYISAVIYYLINVEVVWTKLSKGDKEVILRWVKRHN